MNDDLRDRIFMATHDMRYSEDRNETANWLVNEYAKILTDEQGQEYLEYVFKEIQISKKAER